MLAHGWSQGERKYTVVVVGIAMPDDELEDCELEDVVLVVVVRDVEV